MVEIDVKIKDITTTIKNEHIEVTWKLEYDEHINVNNPIAIAVRYKVIYLFVCILAIAY